MSTPIGQIRDSITQVFGGSNDKQLFTMCIPGIILNNADYAYDPGRLKPATVKSAEFALADMMFDLFQTTGGPNGASVFDAYKTAVHSLMPKFNSGEAAMKQRLKAYLNEKMPDGTVVRSRVKAPDGSFSTVSTPFTGTRYELFAEYTLNYVRMKEDWDNDQAAKRKELEEANPDTAKEAYSDWFEGIAESRLTEIDTYHGTILTVFGTQDMDAIMAALASGPSGALYRAQNVLDTFVSVDPDSRLVMPVELSPSNWATLLDPELNPKDLLADSKVILENLQAQQENLTNIATVLQAKLAAMPTIASLADAKASLAQATTDYLKSRQAMQSQYLNNTAVAAKAIVAGAVTYATGGSAALVAKLTASDSSLNADKLIDGVASGMDAATKAQDTMVQSAQALANAGLSLIGKEAEYFSDLPPLLTKIQNTAASIQRQISDFAASAPYSPSAAPAALANPATPPKPSDIVAAQKTFVDGLLPPIAAAQGTASLASQTGIKSATDALSATITDLGHKGTAVTGATTAQADAAFAAYSAVWAQLGKSLDACSQAVSSADLAAADQSTIKAAVAYASAIDSAKSVYQANTYHPASQSKPIPCSSFTEFTYVFSATSNDSSQSSSASASASSVSCNFFFGGYSGSSSQSQSTSASTSLDQSTSIKVAMKVARVVIDRPWMNTNIFKLTRDMNRLTSSPLSTGAVVSSKSSGSGAALDPNNALFPAFPNSFLIAKDITIEFAVSSDSVDTVKSAMSAQAASGGGCFCFSCSSSSSSSSSSSNMSVKNSATNFRVVITQPQIIGWFLEAVPEDQSEYLNPTQFDPASKSGTSQINVVRFIRELQAKA